MAEGSGRDRWAHTATVLALIANVNRDPKKTRAFKPEQFNPYAVNDRRKQRKSADLTILKEALTGRKGS
ncbi:MAG: hypothetical protein GWP14_04570 [Actinobacteria bacterium]|nr:hypothetical protein [Actinomycetota bacterium]